MPEINDIAILIATRNNHERLKLVYHNIRNFYKTNEIIIVSDSSEDQTNEFLKTQSTIDKNLIIHCSENRLNFAKSYNKTIELCKKEIFVFLHDDTFISENFLENLIKHLQTNDKMFVCFSTCEPPIFHTSDLIGKPIRDFGKDYKTLDLKGFYNFSKHHQTQFKDKTEKFNGGFFMCGYTKNLKEINSFDENFYPHFSEDSDLLHRLTLNGNKFILSLDSLIYHLPSSTSRFSKEFKDSYQQINYNNVKNFIRKWHVTWETIQKFNDQQTPYKKYTSKLYLSNGNINILGVLEPFFDIIILKNNDTIINEYINYELKNTKFDIKKKIVSDSPTNTNFVCSILAENFNQRHMDYINNLQYIIQENDVGSYELDGIIIQILNKNDITNDCIKL